MIRRPLSCILLVTVLALGAIPLRASAPPLIQGQVFGIELCEQAVCGSAIFTALFSGQVGNNTHAFGTIAVSVNHGYPLPTQGSCVPINSGAWQLQLLSGRKYSGTLTGDTICNPYDDGTFAIIADMVLQPGGGLPGGDLTFFGTLSHNTFPPTISGVIQ